MLVAFYADFDICRSNIFLQLKWLNSFLCFLDLLAQSSIHYDQFFVEAVNRADYAFQNKVVMLEMWIFLDFWTLKCKCNKLSIHPIRIPKQGDRQFVASGFMAFLTVYFFLFCRGRKPLILCCPCSLLLLLPCRPAMRHTIYPYRFPSRKLDRWRSRWVFAWFVTRLSSAEFENLTRLMLHLLLLQSAACAHLPLLYTWAAVGSHQPKVKVDLYRRRSFRHVLAAMVKVVDDPRELHSSTFSNLHNWHM